MNKLKYNLLSFAFILTCLFSYAQSDIPARPNPPRLVNDLSKTLTSNEIRSLEQKLVQFDNQTSNQILIVLVKSLNGYPKEEFADILAEKWGAGQKDKDNGIIILIKPKTRSSRGQVRISVGYGLEGVIPDAITKRIVENEMIPSLKQGNYYKALVKSSNILMSLAKKEFSSNDYKKKLDSKFKFAAFAPFLIILMIIIFVRLGRRTSSTYGGRNSSLPLWGMFFLGSSFGSSSHSGSWSNFSGGSGGGGGFGGFGGGGFGGGGAGGSW